MFLYSIVSEPSLSLSHTSLTTIKALTKQGGEAVVLELPNSPGVEFYEALAEARRKCRGRILFYIQDDNIQKEVK